MGYVIDFCFVRFPFFALTDVVFGGGFFCAFAVKKSVMISDAVLYCFAYHAGRCMVRNNMCQSAAQVIKNN